MSAADRYARWREGDRQRSGTATGPVPVIAMPRIELPAGITDTPVTDLDRYLAQRLRDQSAGGCAREARGHLRAARRLQRRAGARPAAKRRRASSDLQEARDNLLCAGILCGVAELLRHEMTPVPERIARIRGRCEERLEGELPRYAIDVENWIRDLAGEDRLTRG